MRKTSSKSCAVAAGMSDSRTGGGGEPGIVWWNEYGTLVCRRVLSYRAMVQQRRREISPARLRAVPDRSGVTLETGATTRPSDSAFAWALLNEATLRRRFPTCRLDAGGGAWHNNPTPATPVYKMKISWMRNRS